MTKAPTISQFRRSFGAFPKMDGAWSGSSYQYHPHGVIMRPMIYTDKHNVHGYCTAAVMTEPDSPILPITNSSASYGGRPDAIPARGKLVVVYDTGRWVGPNGPWRKMMRSHMAAVLLAKRAQHKAEAAAARKRREQETADREAAFALAAKACLQAAE